MRIRPIIFSIAAGLCFSAYGFKYIHRESSLAPTRKAEKEQILCILGILQKDRDVRVKDVSVIRPSRVEMLPIDDFKNANLAGVTSIGIHYLYSDYKFPIGFYLNYLGVVNAEAASNKKKWSAYSQAYGRQGSPRSELDQVAAKMEEVEALALKECHLTDFISGPKNDFGSTFIH